MFTWNRKIGTSYPYPQNSGLTRPKLGRPPSAPSVRTAAPRPSQCLIFQPYLVHPQKKFGESEDSPKGTPKSADKCGVTVEKGTLDLSSRLQNFGFACRQRFRPQPGGAGAGAKRCEQASYEKQPGTAEGRKQTRRLVLQEAHPKSRLGWSGKAPASLEYLRKAGAKCRLPKKNWRKSKFSLAATPGRPYICKVTVQKTTLNHPKRSPSWAAAPASVEYQRKVYEAAPATGRPAVKGQDFLHNQT